MRPTRSTGSRIQRSRRPMLGRTVLIFSSGHAICHSGVIACFPRSIVASPMSLVDRGLWWFNGTATRRSPSYCKLAALSAVSGANRPGHKNHRGSPEEVPKHFHWFHWLLLSLSPSYCSVIVSPSPVRCSVISHFPPDRNISEVSHQTPNRALQFVTFQMSFVKQDFDKFGKS